MSDQTEKPSGVHPKGNDPNVPSEPEVQHKKINFRALVGYTSTDQDQREKDLKEYEASYLARLEKNKPEESSDDFRVELGVSAKPDDDLGKLNLQKHTVTKRVKLQEERRKYKQKYLARHKQPKTKSKKLSNLKFGVDLGTLTLRQYVNVKRKAKQDEIKKYEQKYLARHKQQKAKPKKKAASSNLYKPEKPKPKRDVKKERKEYEQKYLARYKQPKVKPIKSSNLKSDDDLGRLNIRKHTVTKRREYLAKRKEYEEKYILRYMAKLEAKPKKSSSKKLDHDLISGRLNLREQIDKKRKELQAERKAYEKKYLARHKQPKANPIKSSNLKSDDDLGRLNIRKHTVTKRREYQAKRKEYEKEYLARYNKQQKAKPKKKAASSNLYKPEKPKPKRDVKKERKEYEKEYLTRYNKHQKAKPKKKK